MAETRDRPCGVIASDSAMEPLATLAGAAGVGLASQGDVGRRRAVSVLVLVLCRCLLRFWAAQPMLRGRRLGWHGLCPRADNELLIPTSLSAIPSGQ